jgi:hypothetical protein
VREHERLVFVGIQKDPSELQRIADVAIDPMPFGSYTALLETCYYGAYPMVCYGTIPLFDLYKDEAFKGQFTIDLNETEYLKHLKKVCEGKVNINNLEIAKAIKTNHSGNEWLQCFYSILKKENSSEHLTQPSEEDLEHFYELNQPLHKVQYATLSFFHENIHLFTKIEVLKIVFHLISNRYSVKETLGILKKFIIP